MLIRWSGFRGENRALHPKQLAENVGTLSRNQYVGRGDFRPWRIPLAVAGIPGGRQTIYRMGRDVISSSQYWLSWTGIVHAVRSFDATDTTERTYYTGDGLPKVTDNTMALASAPYPAASRPLGIPAPVLACTAIKDSGTWKGALTDVFFVYTYVNDWGWESAPSPPSAVLTRETDATGVVTGFAAVPAGNYQINRIRVYRTEVGTTGAANFFFMSEVAYGTVTVADTNEAIGAPLETNGWAVAPADLKNLTALWNGIFAGISGNAVRFSEPYTNYAWPIGYDVVPPDGTPVALAVFGQSLLVLTTARPVLIAGSSPNAMDQQPLPMVQGCMSARSVVSMGNGIAWASNDGLCWYNGGIPSVLTEGVMTREDWLALRPETMVGTLYEGEYFCSYDDGSGRKGFFIAPGNPVGLRFVDVGYACSFYDELQDQLFVYAGTTISAWNMGNTYMTAWAKSKVFRTPTPENPGAAEVIADTYPVNFKFYADGALKYTYAVPNRSPFRLPSGYAAQDWQLELDAATPVQGVAVASGMADLAAA